MASRLPLSHVRLLYRARNRFGRRTAVVDGPLRFTYAEFVERCEGMAAELLRRGVKPGDTVAFRSFNTHRMLEAYFAPALIGAVFLPINARLAHAEVRAILNHANPRLFWTEPFPAIDYAERVSLAAVDERETAALFYTSGTTGEPKPVRLSRRNLYLHALALSATCQRRQDAVELQVIPLFHANGWGRPHMSVLSGNKIVLQRRFDPVETLRLIEQEGVTDVALVPTMARDLLAHGEGFGRSSLREIHLGGGAGTAGTDCGFGADLRLPGDGGLRHDRSELRDHLRWAAAAGRGGPGGSRWRDLAARRNHCRARLVGDWRSGPLEE